MRTIIAALVATTLVASNAFAASQTVASLPAGKPAGVKEAAFLGPNAFIIFVGLGVVAAGVALSVSNNGGDGVTSTSTTTTSTTGLP